MMQVQKFKAMMINLTLFDQSEAYLLVTGAILVANTTIGGADAINTKAKVTLKNCTRFKHFITKAKNTPEDNIKHIQLQCQCTTC